MKNKKVMKNVMKKASGHVKKQSNGGSVVVGIRINGASSSVSLRRGVVSLWILYSGIRLDAWKDSLVDFIYDCVGEWKGDSAKGFSEFVMHSMILDLMEDEYHDLYNKINSVLKES